MTPLTPTEIEELRIAIATEMGWNIENYGPEGYETLYWRLRKPDNSIREHGCTGESWSRNMFGHMVPPYTTSIDAIQAACLERFKDEADSVRLHNFMDMTAHDYDVLPWQLTALDWAIAFARTSKIWRFKE